MDLSSISLTVLLASIMVASTPILLNKNSGPLLMAVALFFPSSY